MRKKDSISSASKKSTKEHDKEILKTAAIIRTMPDNIAEALANARTKPIWCSDIRWRMELNRRHNRHLV